MNLKFLYRSTRTFITGRRTIKHTVSMSFPFLSPYPRNWILYFLSCELLWNFLTMKDDVLKSQVLFTSSRTLTCIYEYMNTGIRTWSHSFPVLGRQLLRYVCTTGCMNNRQSWKHVHDGTTHISGIIAVVICKSKHRKKYSFPCARQEVIRGTGIKDPHTHMRIGPCIILISE